MQCIVVISGLLFFVTKLVNPDFYPSIAGASFVHKPVNVDQESTSSSKNSENMFIISIAFVVVVKCLQNINSSSTLLSRMYRTYTSNCEV